MKRAFTGVKDVRTIATSHRSFSLPSLVRSEGLARRAACTAIQVAPSVNDVLQAEIVTEATVVNHRTPHRRDWALFIDPNNHESVCQPHHDGLIQPEEKRGHVGSVGAVCQSCAVSRNLL